MTILKKYLWDVQPWYQKVAFVVMSCAYMNLSVIGWIQIFGG